MKKIIKFLMRKKMFWKKKIDKVEEKWNCKLCGHWYKIVDFPSQYSEENGKPKSPVVMLECKYCNNRKISVGNFWDYLPELWKDKDIEYENYGYLNKHIRKHLSESIKNWEEKQKKAKKTKK